ncbi:MAG: hypothetical protein CVV64_20160 [Candidatus Wallbacteria bacterium HGW-Wallbacteria-1]|uniref:Uncharacterized protein n=1 Tax=Candidatus Wallbacteria bacterium HGW-Wallbacteria-1 TaxID=2013854 RepID=A0A2N1PIK1_9BACT|nr:MAG: hypothetical protein CVV64_20160 [Candidatus Wallbacteria bacterium HGW-Wallbacteria-1]
MKIIIDGPESKHQCNGFESTFHFMKLNPFEKDVLARVRKYYPKLKDETEAGTEAGTNMPNDLDIRNG